MVKAIGSIVLGALLVASGSCSAKSPEAARTVSGAVLQQLHATGPKARAPLPPKPKAPLITISAVGDCAIGDLHHGAGAPGSFAARLAEVSDPMAYPFSGVRKVLAEDDLTIANLEGTLTNHPKWTNPVFSIRGKPAYAKMLVQGSVELVNIDNNHSHDYGVEGHEETKASLRAVGVGYFGRGTVARRTVKGVEVFNLGYLGGPTTTRAKAVADVERLKKPNNLVIVSFHWGVEAFYATHPDQRRLGKAVIDAGADLVLGHHPHVLQGIESYKGRQIVYSLGNFVFGANSRPEDMDSIIYQARFELRQGRMVGAGQRIIPVRISSTPSHNDFRPTILGGAQGQRVLDKLSKLSKTLGGVG